MKFYESPSGERTWARPDFIPPTNRPPTTVPGQGQVGANGIRQYGANMIPSSLRRDQQPAMGGAPMGGGGQMGPNGMRQYGGG